MIDKLAVKFGLTSDDIAIDVGCGTGQLTLPIARRVRAVAGVDPEPAMLAGARQAAAEQHMPPPDQRAAFTEQVRRAARAVHRARPGENAAGTATADMNPR